MSSKNRWEAEMDSANVTIDYGGMGIPFPCCRPSEGANEPTNRRPYSMGSSLFVLCMGYALSSGCRILQFSFGHVCVAATTPSGIAAASESCGGVLVELILPLAHGTSSCAAFLRPLLRDMCAALMERSYLRCAYVCLRDVPVCFLLARRFDYHGCGVPLRLVCRGEQVRLSSRRRRAVFFPPSMDSLSVVFDSLRS